MQASLDAPRFCISTGLPDANDTSPSNAGDIDSEIYFEEGISLDVIEMLSGETLYSSQEGRS